MRRKKPTAEGGTAGNRLEAQVDKLLAEHERKRNPSSETDFSDAFADFGVDARRFDKLKQWTSEPEHWRQVLGFLQHLDRQLLDWETSIALKKRFYGTGRQYAKKHSAEAGEVGETRDALTGLFRAIRNALRLHRKTLIEHVGLAAAVPDLQRAITKIKASNFFDLEDDETIPKRAVGRKPSYKISLRRGEAPRAHRRREIQGRLRDILVPMDQVRRGKRERSKDAMTLAQRLLDAMLTRDRDVPAHSELFF